MVNRLPNLILFSAFIVVAVTGLGQVQPAPRLLNGKPDLSAVWDTVHVVDITRDVNVCGSGAPGCKSEGVKGLISLYTPFAVEANGKPKFDYAGHCLPFGYTRSWGAIMPLQLVHGADYLAILFEQNNWFHVVPTDGRDHPKNLEPTWMGNSVGKWDGDTLVIDTIAFNGQVWLDAVPGRVTSDQMHTIERLSRPDLRHLNYELTVDDPKLYTKPFTSKRVFLPMKPGSELLEFSCVSPRDVSK